MIKKQTGNSTDRFKKVLTVSGLLLVILSCIASLYSAYANQRFIHDFLDFIYYFRYFILIGGGFTVGCLLTKRVANKSGDTLFNGAVYSALAISLFELFDMLRITTQGIFEFALFPLGKVSFAGLPLLVIVITVLVACIVRYKTGGTILTKFVKIMVTLSFLFYQTYILANNIYYQVIGVQIYDQSVSLWLILGSYITNPLVIAVISYLLLNTIKTRLDRFFYAGLIAIFYSVFGYVLWEFQANPSIEATSTFGTVTTLSAVLFSAGILYYGKRAK